MKLLFFTDLHLSERPPLARSDSYVDDLFAKLEELKELAGSVDVTVCGGDWLHWPRPNDTSHRLVRRLIECLRNWPTELYTCLGNHELPAEGMSGLRRMPIGVVLEALKDGPVQLLDEPRSVPRGTRSDSQAVTLAAVHWQHDIDGRPELYNVRKPRSVLDSAQARQDVPLVLVTHGMVMPPGGGWPFPAVGMDQIETEADVVLLGHMHWVTGVHQVNGTWFAGPGAVARTSRSESEMTRQPSALIVMLERGKEPQFEEIPLKSARPAEEVFTYAGDGASQTEGLFAGYVAALETGMNLEGLTVEEAVAAAEAKVPSDVMELAKEYLERGGL